MSKRCWRQVVFIEHHESSCGGHFFGLWLECGHHATRPYQLPKPHQILNVRLGDLCAPKRVLCLLCAEGRPWVALPTEYLTRVLERQLEGEKE